MDCLKESDHCSLVGQVIRSCILECLSALDRVVDDVGQLFNGWPFLQGRCECPIQFTVDVLKYVLFVSYAFPTKQGPPNVPLSLRPYAQELTAHAYSSPAK